MVVAACTIAVRRSMSCRLCSCVHTLGVCVSCRCFCDLASQDVLVREQAKQNRSVAVAMGHWRCGRALLTSPLAFQVLVFAVENNEVTKWHSTWPRVLILLGGAPRGMWSEMSSCQPRAADPGNLNKLRALFKLRLVIGVQMPTGRNLGPLALLGHFGQLQKPRRQYVVRDV